jgi:putative acetyltransferase
LLEAVAAEGRWIATEPGFDPERRRRGWGTVKASGLHLVADEEGKVVGTLSVFVPEDGKYTIGMMVRRELRGRGIGSALLEAAFVWARERGIAVLHLDVFPHNDAARRLYEGAGFVETGYLAAAMPRANGEVWDVIEMEKRL